MKFLFSMIIEKDRNGLLETLDFHGGEGVIYRIKKALAGAIYL